MKKIILIFGIVTVLILALYIKDYLLNTANYKRAYENCLVNQAEFNERINEELRNEQNEDVKIHYREILQKFEQCEGCYNECGGCGNRQKSLSFIEWIIKPFKSNLNCQAVCIPYCMERP